ncbi:MAG TPA: GtrA family protein [Sphingomicrobium sp.]|nr:GtrA family protein [Sphingomicrobium sp.]
MSDAARVGQGWAKRLISPRAGWMLARNTLVSCGAFLFDLALLWALVEHGGMDKVLAAALAFIAATSLHYVFGRTWIFRGSDRGVASGYALFLVNAVVGLAITIVLFAAMIRWTPINYLVARVLVSVVAGLAVFLLNAVLNFRRL